MSEQSGFYKDLLDNLHDGVYFVDRTRTITYWNKGAERITGYTAMQAIGRACWQNMLNHVDAEGTPLCRTRCPLTAVMIDGQAREAEVFLHHADGYRVPVHVRGTALRDEQGSIIGAVETFSDMSRLIEAREATQEWRSAALEDALTGVGSRRQIEGRLRGALAEYTHHGGLVGLLFMDIDHFKQVNDTYGHDVGDRVLQLVGTTLLHNLRATDAVGRWGGDEFIAVVTGIPGESALKALAEKLQALVACSRLDLGSSSVAVTLSIGVTLVRPGDTAESIMLRADRQLYHSKGAGSDRVSCGPGSDAAQPR